MDTDRTSFYQRVPAKILAAVVILRAQDSARRAC